MDKVIYLHTNRAPVVTQIAILEEDRAHIANNVHACLRLLRMHDLEILSVHAGRSMPIICIRASDRCSVLEGAAPAYENVMGRERRYMRVTRHDCEVRWAMHMEPQGVAQ